MILLSASEANYANFHWDNLNLQYSGMNVCGNPDLLAEDSHPWTKTSLALIILSKIWIMQLIHIRTQLSQVIDDHIIILTQHFFFILLFHQSFEIRSRSQDLPLVLFSELTGDHVWQMHGRVDDFWCHSDSLFCSGCDCNCYICRGFVYVRICE
jgi:hypothetical protein